MKKQLTFLCFNILIFSCNSSPEKQAQEAVEDYKKCIKENIFKYNYTEDLFAHCDSQLAEKYRLYNLLTISYEKNLSSFDKTTQDSIMRFNDEFLKLIDSLHIHIPQRKYQRGV